MKKKKLLIILLMFLLLISFSFINLKKLKSGTDTATTSNNEVTNQTNSSNKEVSETSFEVSVNNSITENKISTQDEKIVLEEAIEEQNLSGNEELYELVETDYGKAVAVVKNNLQFSTIWAGIQKKAKPNINEIDMYMNQIPNNNGIWIKDDSRDKFLTIFEETIGKGVFYINNEGYLQINENASIKDEYGYISRIKNIIESEHTIIVAIRESHYFIDTASGEIYEEEFEKIAPETPLIFYKENNSAIILLSTNKENKITNEAYLESFLNCCE